MKQKKIFNTIIRTIKSIIPTEFNMSHNSKIFIYNNYNKVNTKINIFKENIFYKLLKSQHRFI